MEKQILYYKTEDGKYPYIEWLDALDLSIRTRVIKRVDKLKDGNYGDHKKLQNSQLSELRMDFGKGYRIYYLDLDTKLVLFLAGSDKKEQKKVIQKANQYLEDFLSKK